MRTLKGIAKQAGIAIAVAAVVDAKNGINGISPALLQTGIAALRGSLNSADYPEAIIACDNLAVGAITKIPGINTIGIAAESKNDVQGVSIDSPCVIGVDDLLQSISEGDIIIVDGYKGEIHIDPDPRTVAYYQQTLERNNLREKVFISSEHIPARMQSGETVLVYAHLSGTLCLKKALDEGADGLLVDVRNADDLIGVSGDILREAAGKPVTFIVDVNVPEILRAALAYCTPGQVALASEDADLLESQVESAMDNIVLEALQLDIDAPDVKVGEIGHIGKCDTNNPSVLVIDASDCGAVISTKIHKDAIVVLKKKIEAIEKIVRVGVRRVAVEPSLIGKAKYAIRSIAAEN